MIHNSYPSFIVAVTKQHQWINQKIKIPTTVLDMYDFSTNRDKANQVVIWYYKRVIYLSNQTYKMGQQCQPIGIIASASLGPYDLQNYQITITSIINLC